MKQSEPPTISFSYSSSSLCQEYFNKAVRNGSCKIIFCRQKNTIPISTMPRNSFISKWDILFDTEAKEWMAFKPALGLQVYPCYSCRHMFYSKKSFQDHINRRAVVLRYQCTSCKNQTMTFYNRCSFLLHCRNHCSLQQGVIDLKNVDITSLPFGLAGFSKHPDIPYLFDVEEEYITDDTIVNTNFYAPNIEDRGKELVSLIPSHMVINRTNENGVDQSLSLKQVAKNIPKCEFIDLKTLKEQLGIQMLPTEDEESELIEVKPEINLPSESDDEDWQATSAEEEPSEPVCNKGPTFHLHRTNVQKPQTANTNSVDKRISKATSDESEQDELVLPVITKVETVDETLVTDANTEPSEMNSDVIKCPECQIEFEEPLRHHFLGSNRPEDEKLRCQSCRLICPTACSFLAHKRVHDRIPPFVCPDCGVLYDKVDQLVEHMDNICFHSSKSVRFKCPGRRCGKIFASEATYAPHFRQMHIDTHYRCTVCGKMFSELDQCEKHLLKHSGAANLTKVYVCQSCSLNDMTWEQAQSHVEFHCNDLTRCMYIYMCRYCKCYFRSVATMSTHLQNCKVQKISAQKKTKPVTTTNMFMNSKYVSGECQICRTRMIYPKNRPVPLCTKCCITQNASSPQVPPKKPASNVEKCICILCKTQIDFGQRRQHQKECKYAKPHVVVEKIDPQRIEDYKRQYLNNCSSSSSNSDLDGLPKHRMNDSTDDSRPKKRHKPAKAKKPEVQNDLTAEQPIPFNGTYTCRLCYYKSCDRPGFQQHIKRHRNISTAYQCMECGECFVVKPSLIKHILHYHNIVDYKRYFAENDCFDQSAVTQLAKVVKAPYLANNVKTNQCKVCMEQFASAEEHDKHFRIHGMAFLMKNTI